MRSRFKPTRWMVRSQQVRRAAFVCVEGIEKNLVESVLDRLGHQLCKPGWSTQADCGGDLCVPDPRLKARGSWSRLEVD